MANEYDLSAVAKEANAAIWDAIEEHAIVEDNPATKEQVIGYAETGIMIILKALNLPEPIRISDHVKVTIEDLSGDMLKVGIHMEPMSKHGDTVVQVFGIEPDEARPGTLN